MDTPQGAIYSKGGMPEAKRILITPLEEWWNPLQMLVDFLGY